MPSPTLRAAVSALPPLFLVSLVSCGAPSAPVDDTAVAATELCERLTLLLCEGNLDCCDRPDRHEDAEACVADNGWLCDLVIGELASSPAFAYDADAAGRLSAAIEASVSTCDAVPDLGLDALLRWTPDAPRVGLARVLTPVLAEGEACGSEGAPALACAAGTRCATDGGEGLSGLAGGGAGICEVVQGATLAEGVSCRAGLSSLAGSAEGASCAAGLVCVPCWASGEPGGCEGSATMTGGTCVTTLALGQTCDPGFDRCVQGSFCDRTRSTCTRPREDGASCISHRECTAGRCFVDDVSGTLAGTCGVDPPERTHCAVWRGRIG